MTSQPEQTPAPQRLARNLGVWGLAVAGGGAGAIFAASVYLPPLALVAPAPLLLERLRGGATSAWLAASLGTALVAAVTGAPAAALFLVTLVLPALAVAETVARGRGLLRGCAWGFLLVAVEVAVCLLLWGDRIGASLVGTLDLLTPAALEQMKTAGTPAENVERLRSEVKQWRAVLAVVYPATLAIVGAIGVLVNATALRLYLVRQQPAALDGDEFETLRLPLALSVAFVLCGAAVAVQPLRPLAYNGLLIIAFLCGLQALAVVAYYARRLGGPPLLRMALVAFVLINPWTHYILPILGLLDLFFDFRRFAERAAGAGE